MSDGIPEQQHGVWCAVGNVVAERPYGPDGLETKTGTKHFKPGAKVYVIDAHWGECSVVMVLGHHRKSNKFIKLSMAAKHLENLRVRLVYSPTVIKMILEHFADRSVQPDAKEYAEELCRALPHWK